MRIIVPGELRRHVGDLLYRFLLSWPYGFEVDRNRSLVTFYSQDEQWLVGYTFAELTRQLLAQADSATPGGVRRTIAAHLASIQESYEQGRARRTDASPTSIVIPRSSRPWKHTLPA